MRRKYENLPETDASVAYIIEEYIQAAQANPERVAELTRKLEEQTVKSCIVIMALVNALVKYGHAE